MDAAINIISAKLMTVVVRTGCIRADHDGDCKVAVKVMREEMKLFIVADHDQDGKYVNERSLALTGQHGLAMASLTAECVRRILAERTS